MSSRARIAIVAAAVVALVVAFVIASGSGDDDKSKTTADTTTAVTPAPAATDTGAATTPETTTTTAAPAAPQVPVITVVDAKPQGGVKRITFTKGDTIRFKVRSDTTDEIHFHGYDVHEDVKAGGTATFSVPATIEGRFIVELEDHGTQIAEVEVDPS
jgi:hypothetical protein